MRAHLAANSLVEVTGNNLTLVYVVLAISLVALAIAYALRAQVLSASDGTEKMREIAAAVQEGAAAYLARHLAKYRSVDRALCRYNGAQANCPYAKKVRHVWNKIKLQRIAYEWSKEKLRYAD